MTARIVVTIDATGAVAAHTEGVYGDRCLDYIDVLEDLLAARTVQSSYTADHTRDLAEASAGQEDHDVDRA